MDTLIALILSCSLHPDDSLVHAFIQRVSDGNIYFVGDLSTVTSHDHVEGLADALALVDDIEKHGGHPAVGLMAVPVGWAARYGRSVTDLFDACINIAIGTDAMASFASACRRSGERSAAGTPLHLRRAASLVAERGCILRRFDVELGVNGYPQGVLSELRRMSADRRNPTEGSSSGHNRVAADAADDAATAVGRDWSDTRLYFPPVNRAPGRIGAGATP
jgi:hypothetical protein